MGNIIIDLFDKTHPLSMNYSRDVLVDNTWWKTILKYYLYHKFSDEETKRLIYNCSEGNEFACCKLNRKNKKIEDWDNKKETVVRTIVMGRFTQCTDLKYELLVTKDSQILVENQSKKPISEFWTKDGNNKYGEVLMQIRDLLKK